ncbi:auxin efflux carrier transmembrane protein [Crassisporium funariophilum]|nr:auxin efflux carrier transmembrane protein [Crassisporium funariophilum]
MLSTGALIWISCRPLIRLVFCTTCGFFITKADVFPAVAARGAGQIMLNIALPCLLFSKLVPAFTTDNISALGPLVLVAILYEALGILMAFVIGKFFWVPHRFRYGILVAGGWGNVGDIPTSVIMSVTGSLPFRGMEDQNLSVAYISAFILVFVVTLFPFGAHRWISMDYAGPDVEPEEVRETMRLKRQALFKPFRRLLRLGPSTLDTHTSDRLHEAKHLSEKQDEEVKQPMRPVASRHVSFMVDDATTVVPTPMCSPPPTEIAILSRVNSLERTVTMNGMDLPNTLNKTSNSATLPMHITKEDPHGTSSNASNSSLSTTSSNNRFFSRRSIKEFIRSIFTPVSMVIFISFPLALIPQLKALFVPVAGVHMPPAPDGLPPLAFIMDATNFVGAASVPLGLICLGSALARLPIPKKGEWKTLPLGAIGWLAVGKMLIMPVLGVLICEGFLVKVGVIPKEDKVLRFVCIFFSCLPTATTQVFLTQVYSGTGSAEHLSAFLIPQYVLMFISMTALTAYTIQLLF